MSRYPTSLSPNYFLGLYADDPDPWHFATSEYERAKYAATLTALPRSRYAAALEIGCSIGVLTRQLGQRCEALTALDVVPAVLDTAREACADQPHIRFLEAAVPADWPSGHYDLILLSEVVYYLDRGDLDRLVDCVQKALLACGDIVLVHYLGETDYPLSGDEAAELFIAVASGFADILTQFRTTEYRLDVLRRAGAP